MNSMPDEIIDIIYSYAKELKYCNRNYNKLYNTFKIKNNDNINKQLWYINKYKKCKQLVIRGCDYLDDHGYTSLYTMNTLCELDISKTNIKDKQLHAICNITKLQNLQIASCIYLTNDGLKFIHLLYKLKILNISSCFFTTVGFNYISKNDSITILIAHRELITIKSINYIRKMKSLLSLNCDKSIIDRNIVHTNIKHVSLQNCNIYNNNHILNNLQFSYHMRVLNLNKSNIASDTFDIITKTCNLYMISIVNCSNLTVTSLDSLSNMGTLSLLIMHTNKQFNGYKYHTTLSHIKSIIVDITFFTRDNYCTKCNIFNNNNKIVFTINPCC